MNDVVNSHTPSDTSGDTTHVGRRFDLSQMGIVIKKDTDISPRLLNRLSDTSNLRPSPSITAKAKKLARCTGR